ncbi:unnamed protein product, partial [Brassica napus]
DDLFFKSDDRDNDEDRDFQTNLEETKPGGVDKEKKEEKEQEGFTRTSTSVPQGPKFLGAAWQRLQLNIFERGLLIEVYGDRGVGELWCLKVFNRWGVDQALPVGKEKQGLLRYYRGVRGLLNVREWRKWGDDVNAIIIGRLNDSLRPSVLYKPMIAAAPFRSINCKGRPNGLQGFKFRASVTKVQCNRFPS